MGNKDVTGRGTASVIHQMEIHTVTAMTALASRDKPSGCTASKMRRNSIGPAQNPALRANRAAGLPGSKGVDS